MSIRDRFLFIQAPIKKDEHQTMDFAKSLAYHYSKGIEFDLTEHISVPESPAVDQDGIRELEILHFKLMIYIWIA
jgi:hypothetical protein